MYAKKLAVASGVFNNQIYTKWLTINAQFAIICIC